MGTKEFLKASEILQVSLCLAVLVAMFRRRLVRDFASVAALVALIGLCSSIAVSILFYRKPLHVSIETAYSTLFFTQWAASVASLLLQVSVLHGLFFNALKPFAGLQRIGRIVFRWVGTVSFAVAVALAAGPQLFARGVSAAQVFTELASRLEQGIGVLILCLLIFVCFAIRPLGLTFRSHIFGVVLGLAVMSTVELVQSAWFATVGAHSVYSPIYLIGTLGICVALGIWGVYFALPEPERRMILLPTTSPFFLWNRISEVLGDAPGHVAVAGFTPSMLAPAEIHMLTLATAREAAAARASSEVEAEPQRLPDFLPEPMVHRAAFALSR